MGTEHTTSKKHAPVGPFGPPLPSEADQKGPMPMAVAGDEDAQQEAFKPTTASKDQMDADVARRYRDPNLQRASDVGKPSPTPHGEPPGERADENRRMEDPPGYEDAPQHGYRQLKDDLEEA
ncbi:MAG TPA: hypothetical protein VNX21_07765 [Candidatus Thermoplasmatota archaeon]|nr:hypothetical protein [Candidatus Thermoplasmatota archaeon]